MTIAEPDTEIPRRIGGLGWLDIARLGLVQASLGSVVVLTTSTLNRVMVVELALLAAIPGALVGLHYAVQLLRPLWGHASDVGGSRTRWIVGGVGLLAVAGMMAAASVALMAEHFVLGLVIAVIAYTLIGFGIGAAGTSTLALLASRTAPARRPGAATLVWTLMIAGIVVTAATTGAFLDPFGFERLLGVTAVASISAFLLAVIAIAGIERRTTPVSVATGPAASTERGFTDALVDTWSDREARLFTVFVFVSMLAYSAQDLILEPFGGAVHGMSPGETTQLAGTQHGGVLLGMILVGTLGTWLARRRPGVLKATVAGGCVLSALALSGLAASAAHPAVWPVSLNVFALGVANGAFAVAAIGSMMALAAAGKGGAARAGIRMGVWGAAQAVAFGLGGLLGAVSVDLASRAAGLGAEGYALVFGVEASVFLVAAALAARLKLLGGGTTMTVVPDHDLATLAANGR